MTRVWVWYPETKNYRLTEAELTSNGPIMMVDGMPYGAQIWGRTEQEALTRLRMHRDLLHRLMTHYARKYMALEAEHSEIEEVLAAGPEFVDEPKTNNQ